MFGDLQSPGFRSVTKEKTKKKDEYERTLHWNRVGIEIKNYLTGEGSNIDTGVEGRT